MLSNKLDIDSVSLELLMTYVRIYGNLSLFHLRNDSSVTKLYFI